MKFTRRIVWGIVGCSVGVILVLVVLRLLASDNVIPNSAECISETRETLPNVLGGDFEIVYTNCDTLAKEEWISVYVTSRSWIRRLLAGKTLLFRYDPGSWNSPLPAINVSGQNRLLVSIARVSSFSFQKKKWQGVSVDYQIGRIDYPEPGESQSVKKPPR